MNIKKNIQKIVIDYPKITLIGYQFMKKIWHLKAGFTNFNYPEKEGIATISKAKVLEYNKERDFGPKKRICYAPFNNLHFKINGDIASCSFNKETTIGNIKESTIRDLWFGDTINQLRESLGNYNFNKCYGCKMVLESGNYRSFPANKYDYHSSDNVVYPTQMSFEISNICNLECLMCDEELSSAIRKNKAKLPALKDVYPSDFNEQLKEFIPHLSIATFIGGEPLLIKRYYEIWEEIIKTNTGCKIHLQTNATYLPDKFMRLLESEQFDVGISIEGCTKETYEKIRVRGNFEVVEQNIKKLVALKNEGKVYLNINFCPLTLNWKEIPLMVDFCNGFKVPLKLLNVETPRHLALINQSSTFLESVLNYLISFELHSTELDFTTARNAETYASFIKSIKSYITEAQLREDFFGQQRQHTTATLKIIFEELFKSSNVFSYLTENEKKNHSHSLSEFIFSLSDNETLNRLTLIRFIYFFKKIMNEEDRLKNIQKSMLQLKKEAADYFQIEKEEFNINLKTKGLFIPQQTT